MHNHYLPLAKRGIMILLVGNGPIENKADIIHSADIVVRFNGFEIEGHEQDVGTKTDIYCFPSNAPKIQRDRPYNSVWIVERTFSKGMKDEHLTDKPTTLIPYTYERQVMKGLEHRFPSTGLVALYYATQHYEDVHIVGFTSFDPAQPYHYYWPSDYRPVGASLHTSHEAEYIGKMQDRGRVCRI